VLKIVAIGLISLCLWMVWIGGLVGLFILCERIGLIKNH
jgi:hypothetical protein